MVQEIQLANKKGTALIDDADLAVISGRKWYLHTDGYAMARKGSRSILMHRLIMSASSGQEVDHINGQPLDNRRTNLRICTGPQNKANRKPTSANTSGFKGVSWDKDKRKWRAAIRVNGKSRHLGYFPSAETAALVYDKAAGEYQGEFAKKNFQSKNDKGVVMNNPTEANENIDNSPMQLVVFEREARRHSWRYISTYKAGDQEELTKSENAIRGLFNALHASDGVRWIVIAREGDNLAHYWDLTRRGRNGRRSSISVNAPEKLGAVVLEFPEADETPRCETCGAILPAIGNCTVCGQQSAMIQEVEHARSQG